MLKLNTYVNIILMLVGNYSNATKKKNPSFYFSKFASKDELINEMIPWELAGAGYNYLSKRRFLQMAGSPFPIEQERSWRERSVLRSFPLRCLPCECSVPSFLSLEGLFDLSTGWEEHTVLHLVYSLYTISPHRNIECFFQFENLAQNRSSININIC